MIIQTFFYDENELVKEYLDYCKALGVDPFKGMIPEG